MPEPVQKMMAQTQSLMQTLVDTETAEGALLSAIAEGRAFSAGAKVAIGAGGTGAIRLENPAGSGRTIMIFRFVFASDMDDVDVQFVKNPTQAGGTVVEPFGLNFIQSVEPVAAVHSGVDILSAGTLLSPLLLLGARVSAIRDLPLVIGPGMSAAAQLSIGALANADFYGSVFWYEKDIQA